MRKIKMMITLMVCFFTAISFSQQKVDRFEITPDGINQFIIIETEGSAEELFTKTNHWINRNFKTPNEVMPRIIENELIGGVMTLPNALYIESGARKGFAWHVKLSYTFEFKDDRFKFEIFNVSFPQSNETKGETTGDIFYKGGGLTWSFYNNKGTLKNWMYNLGFVTQLESSLNDLHEKLKEFIEDDNTSDW